MHVVLDTSDFKNARITGSQSQIDLATYNEATKSGNILPGFIEQHPDSYVSAYLITCHHFPLDTLRYFYSSLTGKVKRCVYGKIIFQNIHRKELLAVGKRAPAFSQEDKNGKQVSLKELRGKYVLLQFWGSWNMASKMENREILHAYNSYKNKNLAIISVSLDGKKTRKTWLAAIEKDSLSWTQLAPLKAADNPVAIKYDVETLPANFLIGPAGRIIATDLKGEVLRKTFERIFPSVSTR